MNAEAILTARLQPPRSNWLTIDTDLEHFALVNYAVPVDALARIIPTDRFEIAQFDFGNGPSGLISAVPFVDAGFHLRVLPFARFYFGQTNYRAYIIDKASGQHCVWFFGTTLGGRIVHIPRALWKIPWHLARYQVDCKIDPVSGRYTRYRMHASSDWSAMQLELADSGAPATTHPGFASADDFRLILTHPVDGYFYGLDGHLGTYSVWHDVIPLTQASATHAYFGIFERLGLLTRAQMLQPLSVLLCPRTRFTVLLPPRGLGISGGGK